MMMMLPCWCIVLKLVAAAGGQIVGGSCLIVLLSLFDVEFLQVMMGGCDAVAGAWPGASFLTWTVMVWGVH